MTGARLLARGWLRGRRGAWGATAAVLSVALALMVLVSGLFAGMQAETEGRVADVFTGDLRVTPTAPGVLDPGLFGNATATAAALGDDVTPVLESQMVLSRRGFLELLVAEEDQYTFRQADGGDIHLGLLVGVPFGDPAAVSAFGRHVVSGTLPGPWRDDGPVPLVLSVRAVRSLLTPEEREALGDDPFSAATRMPLEITAAVVTQEAGHKDIIRRPARIVAVYETGIDTLDDLTAWAPMEATRVLQGYALDDDVANAVHVRGGTATAKQVAADAGWSTETPAGFTVRYLGQLVTTLRVLSMVAVAALFVVPAFLVAHGVERTLEAQRHEVAVLRAIGVDPDTIRAALGGVVAGTLGLAVLAASVLVVVGALALHAVLPAWAGPLPMDVRVTVPGLGAALGVAILGVAGAFGVAVWSHGRTDPASALRAA